MRIQAELTSGVLKIAIELGARREQPAPLGVGVERQLIPQRGDVDGQAGVVVVAPGAAEVVGAFENDEVGDSLLAQQMCCGDAAGPCADDRDLVHRLTHARLLPGRRRCARPRSAAPHEGWPGLLRWAVTARSSTTFAQSIRLPARYRPRLRLLRASAPRVPSASTTRWNSSSGPRRYCAAAAPECFR